MAWLDLGMSVAGTFWAGGKLQGNSWTAGSVGFPAVEGIEDRSANIFLRPNGHQPARIELGIV